MPAPRLPLLIDPPLVALLLLVGFVSFLAMPAERMIGDPFAMREESRALLLHGTLAVPDEVDFGEPGQYFTRNPRDGRLYSKYGILCGLLYALPLGVDYFSGGELPKWGSADQVFLLNVFNLGFSLLLAALLYGIGSHFSRRPWGVVLWVLLCCYSTYLWYYLRAQNSEIFQSVFFAGFYWCWLKLTADDAPRTRANWLVLGGLWLCVLALSLTKMSYVLLGPYLIVAHAVWLVRCERQPMAAAAGRALQMHGGLALLSAAVVLGVNQWKFGSPFASGYHQWPPQGHGLIGRWSDSLASLLFSPHWSLFGHFPLLLLALPFVPGFLKRSRGEYLFVCGFAVLYTLLVSRLQNWRGEWCYGPRYFLFYLPMLSLPALAWFEADWSAVAVWRRRLIMGTCGWLLAYSAFLQVQVNRFPFFAYYQATNPLSQQMPLPMAAYFLGHQYGFINWDLSDPALKYRELEWWQKFVESHPPAAVRQYEADLSQVYARENWFWFSPPY